ncbi:GNAT family N-acetyltransferase [Lacticaseibacillus hulanensis]|uniref:GNAT family N-acetyltransferase n=1 Tax=Lacticaseibacillus hulanensis TaxID=2493111 RepID=UPI000FDABB6D|nr:GNAT family N-acetyltransferase [Lacticaseibacillus hulanensis]
MEVFAVNPAAQGQGVGRALLKSCLTELKAAGADFVEIFTRSDLPANHLYQSIGAHEIAHNWRALATPKNYDFPKAKWTLNTNTKELVVTTATDRVEVIPQYPQWFSFFTEAAMADFTITQSYMERTYLLIL